MKRSNPILFAVATLSAVVFLPAGVSLAADEFDFSELDKVIAADKTQPAPQAGIDAAFKGLPESIASVLTKLSRYRNVLRGRLNADIVAGRKIAAEMLVRESSRVAAASAAGVLQEAKRVEELDPAQPLVEDPPGPPGSGAGALQHSLMQGLWSCTPFARETRMNQLLPNGSMLENGTHVSKWRWLDESRGVFYLAWENGWEDLMQIQAPGKAIGVNKDGHKYGFERRPGAAGANAPSASRSEVVTKLAASERELRRQTETRIQAIEAKISKWLQQQSATLTVEQASAVLTHRTSLERPRAQSGAPLETSHLMPTDKLRGQWLTDGKLLEFADGGELKVNGKAGGRWAWIFVDKSVALTAPVGSAIVPVLGKFSDAREGWLQMLPVSGGMSDAKKQPVRK